jgi:FRG domain-containing protein
MPHVAPLLLPCKTVDELWAWLDPMCPLVDLAGNPRDLVFRGQGDSDWDLEPSVCRPYRGRRRTPAQLVSARDILTAEQHAFAELRLLQSFVEACDLCALPLPIDSAGFREKWILSNSQRLNDIARSPETWPPKELFDLLAIAQHHRVPTRLLDWTRRSHVAAYFAAEGGLDGGDREEAKRGRVGSGPRTSWPL